MKKTEFEELWSEIHFTDRFDKDKIFFYYEDRFGLLELPLDQIISKEKRIYTINKNIEDDWEVVEVPEHIFWVVMYNDRIIFDRRHNYQGKKDLSLPEHLDTEKIYYDGNEIFQPLIKAIKKYNWKGIISSRLFACINTIKKWDLTLYNYNNNVLVPRNHPILTRCRGIIIDNDGNTVNYPLDRFFNYFERECANITWDNASIQEKVDGTMISVFWHKNNGWVATTRGAFYPLEDNRGNNVDFEELFINHFQNFDRLQKGYSYVFELVTKENRIVTHYGDLEFVSLLFMRNLFTHEEVEPKRIVAHARELGVHFVTVFLGNSLEDTNAILDTFEDDQEGLVIVDRYYNRMKIKQESYIKLSRIKMLKEDDLFDYVLGKIQIDEEILAKDKEVMVKINEIRDHWNKTMEMIERRFYAFELKHGDNRKDFAQMALMHPYKSVLFAMLDRKFDIKTHSLKWKDVKEWLK